MTRKPVVLIGALVLALTVLAGTVQFATAAPVKRYKVADCHSSQGIEICYTDAGTVQENETPSGNVIFAINNRVTYTIVQDGVVVETSAANYHFNGVWTGEEPKVFHGASRSWIAFDGTTCSYDSTFIYINGEVRRDIENLVCN